MAEFQLIDLSHHNTVTDFLAVKNAGIYGVILRAGYGREISQKDRKFDEFYAAAKGVGLHIGAYWYSYADSVADAAKEANACLACIQGKQFDFPVYYDLEEQSTAALGRDTCTQIAQTFCSSVEQAGYWAGVYANTNWFTNYLNFDPLAAKYTIWLADYRDNYNTTLKRDMHQYTSTGSVAGVNGNVDLDRCTRDFPAEIGSLYGDTAVTPEVPQEGSTVRCTGEHVNIRADAHTGAAVLTQANTGDTLTWLADDGWGWSKVQKGSVTGWMVNQYLDKAGLSPYKVGSCTGNDVRVRNGPGLNYSIKRKLNKGNLFRIICILPNGWVQVDIEGNWGYVSGEYVRAQ